MRVLLWAATFVSCMALVAPSHAAGLAQASSGAARLPSGATAAKPSPVAVAVDPGKAARDRMDAQQAAWDKKMKAVSGTICVGC
jgi:hypothetical protein